MTHSFSRFASLAPLLLLGCNTVLGVNPATLENSADSGLTTSSLCRSTGDRCMDCVSGSCCSQYQQCTSASSCDTALGTYNYCVLHDGGAQCAEIFAQDQPAGTSLVRCAFDPSNCGGVCDEKTLDSTCASYCQCFERFCPGFQLDGGSCLSVCLTLTPAQVLCRQAHCVAGASHDPATHCPHVVGNPPCR